MKTVPALPQFYTPLQVGRLTGFSASFIRGEIKAGELEATYVTPPGRTRGRWLITVTVALAYARKLGVEAPLHVAAD